MLSGGLYIVLWCEQVYILESPNYIFLNLQISIGCMPIQNDDDLKEFYLKGKIIALFKYNPCVFKEEDCA